MNRITSTLVFMSFLLVSCSSTAPKTPKVIDETNTGSRVTEADLKAAQEFRTLMKKDAQEAYRQGVQDTLLDFRGKMNARVGFVWQPPVVEYIDVPARVVNGALIPAHKEPVIIKPGTWIEANGVALPRHDSE